MSQPNFLRGFIYAYWGGISEFADAIGVAPSTVYTWIDFRPRGLLKFAPEIVKNDEVSADMVIQAVVTRESQLKDGET